MFEELYTVARDTTVVVVVVGLLHFHLNSEPNWQTKYLFLCYSYASFPLAFGLAVVVRYQLLLSYLSISILMVH